MRVAYFCHDPSDDIWMIRNITEEQIEKELMEPMVDLISEDCFNRLAKKGWNVTYFRYVKGELVQI